MPQPPKSKCGDAQQCDLPEEVDPSLAATGEYPHIPQKTSEPVGPRTDRKKVPSPQERQRPKGPTEARTSP